MYKKVKVVWIGTIALFITVGIAYIVTQAQEQKVALKYQAKAGNVWKYECITEKESDRTAPTQGKSLHYIKQNFKDKIIEISPEGYLKYKTTWIPIEEKNVYIDMLTKEKTENCTTGGEPMEWLAVMTMTPCGEWIENSQVITPLPMMYDRLLDFFWPVLPKQEAGVNDTWKYEIALLPVNVPGFFETYAKNNLTPINYKVLAFEKKDGFDCVKIEYHYEVDYTDKISEDYAKDEEMKNCKWEVRCTGKGVVYFAYNEGFLVSKKENLMTTDIESELINGEWKVQSKCITRLGFTMNYIKP